MVEEEPLFIGPDIAQEQVRLDWILVEEMLRGLDQSDSRIVEQRHGPPQKLAVRHEVSIEDGDELWRGGVAAQDLERMVDVTGLGMKVVGPGEILRPLVGTQLFQPGATPIIQDPDPN